LKVLVTGGYGFIGHNVVQQLEHLGHSVVIVDNCTNYDSIPWKELFSLQKERSQFIKTNANYRLDIESKVLNKVFQTHCPTIVIHLASFPRQKTVSADPIMGARTMIEGLVNLCELSREHKVTRFVNVSSSMVYGDFVENVPETALCNPQGQYGILKHAGEKIVQDCTAHGYFDHTIVRPSAVYGPRDVEDRVVAKFMLAAIRGETLNVNGSKEHLDFTYVEDAAAGIVGAALSENTANKTYNITRSQSRSLLEAAELAIKIAGKGNIVINPKNQNYPSRGSLNTFAAQRDFGFNPKIDIEEGFQRYYEYLTSSLYWSSKTVQQS